MRTRIVSSALLVALLQPALVLAQGFDGLEPGRSTRQEVERAYGEPLRAFSATLVEYRSRREAEQIFVQYRKGSAVVERIEKISSRPTDRSSVLAAHSLPAQPTASRVNDKGRLEEYYAAGNVVLTFVAGDQASGVGRIGRYSKSLFDVVVANARSNREKAITRDPGSRADGKLGPDLDGWQFTGENATNLTYFNSPSVAHCRAECEKNPACKAFGWIRPNGYVAGDPSMCYLMSDWKKMTPHPCCISAVRE